MVQLLRVAFLKTLRKQTRRVFSHTKVYLEINVACNRNPSHDEVMLPAFFRHCIDYIEQYGLSSEGIYRVIIITVVIYSDSINETPTESLLSHIFYRKFYLFFIYICEPLDFV
ncbi:unnamed protein product [Trichobilharzia regenti]|nr:unnamed protein product [Trichobilharzia regenti]